jgi:hypothetical protein
MKEHLLKLKIGAFEMALAAACFELILGSNLHGLVYGAVGAGLYWARKNIGASFSLSDIREAIKKGNDKQ